MKTDNNNNNNNNYTSVLINLSGHPAPRGAEKRFKVVSVKVPTVDLGDEMAVSEAAKNLVEEALADEEAKEALLRGEASVILPGATALAGPVLALLVGVSGSFPTLYWAVRDQGAFRLSQGLELQALRLEARALRE